MNRTIGHNINNKNNKNINTININTKINSKTNKTISLINNNLNNRHQNSIQIIFKYMILRMMMINFKYQHVNGYN